jgi:hypothetical protein
MTRRILIALVCLFTILQTGCQESDTQEDALVRTCYEGYKQAILDQDGDAAVAMVDETTLKYYGEMRHLALEGTADVVHNLTTIDKIMVLMLRHQILVEDLNQMNAESLFVYAVDQGWIGRESVANIDLGDITVSGDQATGVHISGGTKSSLKWKFQKENGAWKIDITSIMPMAEQAFQEIIQESGQSEDEFLVTILESISGKNVPRSIWDAPRRRSANQ